MNKCVSENYDIQCKKRICSHLFTTTSFILARVLTNSCRFFAADSLLWRYDCVSDRTKIKSHNSEQRRALSNKKEIEFSGQTIYKIIIIIEIQGGGGAYK